MVKVCVMFDSILQKMINFLRVLLILISGGFGSSFVVSASLPIQSLRKRGPEPRKYFFSRPCRISLAKNKEGSRIPRDPPLDRSVYTLFKHSKKLYSLAKGRQSMPSLFFYCTIRFKVCVMKYSCD